METSVGILFNRKSGKVVKTLTGHSSLLKLFAMNNVSATRDYVVFNADGICEGYFEGKKNDMPTICRDMVGKKAEDFGFSSNVITDILNN
jgi:hypothetical protein